jgi:hypothetical protein
MWSKEAAGGRGRGEVRGGDERMLTFSWHRDGIADSTPATVAPSRPRLSLLYPVATHAFRRDALNAADASSSPDDAGECI